MLAGVTPASTEERSANPLRPTRLADVIGQQGAKSLMRRAIDSCFERRQPLPHTLLIGPSGTGKTTFAHVVGAELGVEVWEIEAPVSFDTLLALRTTMPHGSILKVDEIHQQAIMERRGRSAATQPEVFYSMLEDRVLVTATGVLEFPNITVIGTTTDEGMLPDAFINRFPLRPRLAKYTPSESKAIVSSNAAALRVTLDDRAAGIFATACRGVPREANNLVKNAAMLFPSNYRVGEREAREVLSIIGVTEDGLTADMQAMLTFLLTRARQETGDGEVKYQASVNTIATAIGKSRDSKAIALRVEPYLIEHGYVQVGHGGRRLTDAGIRRAGELLR